MTERKRNDNMGQQIPPSVSRRGFLRQVGGATLAVAGAGMAGGGLLNVLRPESVSAAPSDYDLWFAGTDGWMSLPANPAIPPFHPDDMAPNPFNAYIFGFRNLTGLNNNKAQNQKFKAAHPAPMFWLDENVPFKLRLGNLGLQLRPDLTDAHTLHWHGFRNVIPFFDGEPSGSVSVPIGGNFTYVYVGKDPGTYMVHCHVEDVEHVHMGMTGLVFIRPAQNGNTTLYPSGQYLYNDGDGSTGYDREFGLFLSEFWAEAHWADSHVQLPEWSDYHVDFALLNGRVYPDTLAPNGSIDPFNPVRANNGDLIAPTGRPDLQYQPNSSLVTCNAGDQVALRLANLGFIEGAMTLAGIPMKVVGKDAGLLRGRDGTDQTITTHTVSMGAGESRDVIFTAPPHSGGTGPDTYLLYNRAYARGSNPSGASLGGQATEIHVYPPGDLPAQAHPNDLGI
jgi:FtsP/CotA-like multicopper oxidase with cupredoxin domain